MSLLRKFWIVVLCGSLQALPSGNPSHTHLLNEGVWPCERCEGGFWSALSARAGFTGNYVFNRHMRVKRPDAADVIDKTQIFSNSGFVALNWCERVDLFATFGAATFAINDNMQTFLTASNEVHGQLLTILSSADFCWSVGGRMKIWSSRCFSLGLQGEYFQAHLPISFMTYQGNTTFSPTGFDVSYRDWQIGLGWSYHFSSCLIPYATFTWANAQADFDNPIFTLDGDSFQLFDLTDHRHWGYALGLTFAFCKMASVDIEARFADQKAVYLNGQVRF